MSFPCFLQTHDPDDAKTYTFRFALNDGDSVATGAIDIVDATSTTVITGSDLTLTNLRPGAVDDAGAVFFKPVGGGLQSIYWLRCTATTTLGDTYVQTLGLRVGQQ
jgi:hypothetical protein